MINCTVYIKTVRLFYLLLELVLELLGCLHAVLRRTQDAAHATLLLLCQLAHPCSLSLLQDALDQATRCRYPLRPAQSGDAEKHPMNAMRASSVGGGGGGSLQVIMSGSSLLYPSQNNHHSSVAIFVIQITHSILWVSGARGWANAPCSFIWTAS